MWLEYTHPRKSYHTLVSVVTIYRFVELETFNILCQLGDVTSERYDFELQDIISSLLIRLRIIDGFVRNNVIPTCRISIWDFSSLMEVSPIVLHLDFYLIAPLIIYSAPTKW